jgi:hypothetical protein
MKTRIAHFGSVIAPNSMLFLQFIYLQAMDVLTTLAFLLGGVKEGNPLVNFAIAQAGNPLSGLVLVKMGALALGVYCLLSGRRKLLQRANVFFALLVAWNMVCLILGLALKA